MTLSSSTCNGYFFIYFCSFFDNSHPVHILFYILKNSFPISFNTWKAHCQVFLGGWFCVLLFLPNLSDILLPFAFFKCFHCRLMFHGISLTGMLQGWTWLCPSQRPSCLILLTVAWLTYIRHSDWFERVYRMRTFERKICFFLPLPKA